MSTRPVNRTNFILLLDRLAEIDPLAKFEGQTGHGQSSVALVCKLDKNLIIRSPLTQSLAYPQRRHLHEAFSPDKMICWVTIFERNSARLLNFQISFSLDTGGLLLSQDVD